MTPSNLDETRCWQAVQTRDAQQDGIFVYGVITTGVYCRPSCPGRRAKRENVRFYPCPADAERDGLRPCLRCRPLAAAGADPATQTINDLCRYIEAHAATPLTLADMSRHAKLSPFHLQRTFRAIVGVTPKQYLDSYRLRTFKSILRDKAPDGVTGAIYEAGFGSSSRVYERAGTQLGMTPMEYRAGGQGIGITYAAAQTPLGLMLVGATTRGLCFLQFGPDVGALVEQLRAEYPRALIEPMREPAPSEFSEWMQALNGYLAGHEPDLRLPLHVRATAFQLRVWQYLQSIPCGSVQSYEEVARGIHQPKAARAVARACASNHVAVAIPCHRVIRGTGELGGYRWGLDRKRVLLDAERKMKATEASAAH